MQIFRVCTDYRVLVMSIVTMASVVCTAYVLQQFDRQKWDAIRIFLNGLTAALGFPCEFNPTRFPLRLGFFIVLFGCWLVAIAFSTFHVRVYSVPYLNPQIKSVSDITAKNFRLTGDHFALMKLRAQVMAIK